MIDEQTARMFEIAFGCAAQAREIRRVMAENPGCAGEQTEELADRLEERAHFVLDMIEKSEEEYNES